MINTVIGQKLPLSYFPCPKKHTKVILPDDNYNSISIQKAPSLVNDFPLGFPFTGVLLLEIPWDFLPSFSILRVF